MAGLVGLWGPVLWQHWAVDKVAMMMLSEATGKGDVGWREPG